MISSVVVNSSIGSGKRSFSSSNIANERNFDNQDHEMDERENVKSSKVRISHPPLQTNSLAAKAG